MEQLASGGYNAFPLLGNMVLNAGIGLLQLGQGLIDLADLASDKWGVTGFLGKSPSQTLEAINPAMASELQMLRWRAPATRCAAKMTVAATRFEGLTAEQIAAVKTALQKAGISDPKVLIKGADMPVGYTGMTLGDEGFVVNRSVINNAEELQNTLLHEYQHILDRRALGDPGAYGQALEDAARAAEHH